MRGQKTLWWGALGLMLLVGLAFYLTGYDRGLPIYESRDERRNLHEVLALRGLTDDELWKPGYPPGILWVNYGAQYLTEWVTQNPATQAACDVIRTIRLFGVPFHLASALLIALIGRRLGGNWVGLTAAGAWLFSAGILDQTQYAFPQTYEHISYLLAFWLALLALDAESPAWAIGSTLAALAAVIFKYTAFPVLGLGVGVALWLTRREPARWGGVLAVQFALIGLCAAWLFFGYGATQLIDAGHEETNNVVQGETLTNILDPVLVLLRAGNLSAQVGVPLAVLGVLLVVGVPLYWRQSDTVRRLALVALGGVILSQLLNVVLTLATNFDGLRQNIPATGLLAVLVALLLGAIAQRLPNRAGTAFIAVALAVWLLPLTLGGWRYVQHRALPVSYAAFTQWAVDTLPINYTEGQPALLALDDRPFTTPWTCARFPYYPAVQPGRLDERPLEAWTADGVAFAQVDVNTPLPAVPLPLLVAFPPEGEGDEWRSWRRGLEEHRLRVYHLLPIANRVDTVFGEGAMALAGYTLPERAPGEPLRLWLYWQATAPDTDYQVYLHVTPPGERDNILAQGDAPPTGNPYRPTSTWGRPGEMLYPGYFEVPVDLPPGEYELYVGLYDRVTGARLTTATGADAVVIPVE